MNSGDALKFLLLGGFLGLFGQGVRALVGLNLLKDYANGPNPSQADVFNAARLAISLVVGFLAGVATALVYVLKDDKVVSDIGPYLLPFAGAGYVGTDVIEAFYVKYFDAGSSTGLKAPQAQLDSGSSPDSVTALEQIKPDLLAARVVPSPCGNVKVGAQQPQNIKTMVLAAIGAPANTPDKTQISALMNASTGNPIWEAAIQCMHYGQFNTDELNPMPIYFNTNGATVGGFVKCIQCCYSHPLSN
jgi:hypothetical protein